MTIDLEPLRILDPSTGRPAWRFADGTILPVIAGGADGDGATAPGTQGGQGGNEGGAGTGAGGAAGTAGARTFSQEELAATAAREKAEGRRAAEAHIAEQLGMKPEEAARLLREAAEAKKAAMDEADRKALEADEKARAAEAKEAAALERERLANLKLALAGAVRPDRLAAALAVAPTVDGFADFDLSTDTGQAALGAAVAKAYPEWAPTATGDGTGTPPPAGQQTPPAGQAAPPAGTPGTGAPGPKPPKGNPDGLAEAAKRAAARYQQQPAGAGAN